MAKGRPRTVVRGSFATIYTDTKTRNYEAGCKLLAKIEMGAVPPFEGPLAMTLEILLPIPPSWSKKKQAEAESESILPIGRPDIDNFIKAIQDSLNGVVFIDDSQIVIIMASKFYSRHPGTLIQVRPFDEVSKTMR